MASHEEKYCPRCNQPFECKVGNILQCQCFGVNLTENEKAQIEKQFSDCLCRKCLLELKGKFANGKMGKCENKQMFK